MKLMQRYELLSSSTGLAFFSLSEIRDSTGNFAASNVIGEGGFSTVYRGVLPNGSRIAVKRLKYSAKIKEGADFSHELRVISRIKHCNLLPIRGYCVEFNEDGQISEQLLVSDLMENGSLADCLFNPNRSTCLSWPERYKIAVGIARGLTYLHEFAKPAIIHRDIKAANVLLDGHFNALVADFGLAKLKKEEEDKTHYSTRTVGTLGYVAPEYALYGHLTRKSDVFSFGIILLELITGRRALNSTSGVLEHFLLSDWVVDMTQNNRAEEVIDRRIRNSGYRKTIEKVLLLALQCAHPKDVSRPSMSEALLVLEAIDGPLSGTKDIKSELEASCNSRGDFTWFLPPGMRREESTSD
jgi:serine/threonine protein kinase